MMKRSSEKHMEDYLRDLLDDVPQSNARLQEKTYTSTLEMEREQALEELLAQTEVVHKLQLDIKPQSVFLPPQDIHIQEEDAPFKAIFFLHSGHMFVAPIRGLRGVCRVDGVVRLFGYAPWMLGVTSYQECLMSVVDLAQLLRLKRSPPQHISPYLLLLDGLNIGLTCEEILDIRLISPHEVHWEKSKKHPVWCDGFIRSNLSSILNFKEIIKMVGA